MTEMITLQIVHRVIISELNGSFSGRVSGLGQKQTAKKAADVQLTQLETK